MGAEFSNSVCIQRLTELYWRRKFVVFQLNIGIIQALSNGLESRAASTFRKLTHFDVVATIYRFTRITLVRVRGNCVQFEHFELHLVGTDKKEMVYIIRECVFKIATKLITANMCSRMICIPEPLNSFVFRVKSASLISHIILVFA